MLRSEVAVGAVSLQRAALNWLKPVLSIIDCSLYVINPSCKVADYLSLLQMAKYAVYHVTKCHRSSFSSSFLGLFSAFWIHRLLIQLNLKRESVSNGTFASKCLKSPHTHMWALKKSWMVRCFHCSSSPKKPHPLWNDYRSGKVWRKRFPHCWPDEPGEPEGVWSIDKRGGVGGGWVVVVGCRV